MMNFSHLAWKIVDKKLKYAVKTLSDDAVEHSYLTISHNFDSLSFSFDFTLSDTLYSSLLASILLGIPFSDIIPASLDFRIDLPSPDEWIKGLLIKIEPTNIAETYPELLTISSFMHNVFEENIASAITDSQLRKGVYGVETYGNSYYDPQGVTQFFRSTMFALTKKRSTDETIKTRFAVVAKILDIREELAETLFNSMQMVYYSKIYAACFDYAWFDVTLFPREESPPRLFFIGWDLTPAEAETTSLIDNVGCCYFDSCFFDLNIFAAEEAPTIYITERAGMLLTEVSMYMSQKAKSRLLATPLAVANYQTTVERMNPTSSIRLESYAVSTYLTDLIREVVAKTLEKHVQSSTMLNLYASAALELVKRVTKPGGWGDDVFRIWSYNELRKYFVERWFEQGLDPELLNLVFDALIEHGFIEPYKNIRSEVKNVVKNTRR